MNVQKNLKTHSQPHTIILMDRLFEEHTLIVHVSFHVSLHKEMENDISMMVWKLEVEMLEYNYYLMLFIKDRMIHRDRGKRCRRGKKV